MPTPTNNDLATLQALQRELEAGKTEQVRAETNLSNLTEQLGKERAKLAEMGIENTGLEVEAIIAKLDSEIANNDQAINEKVNMARGLINPAQEAEGKI